MPKLRRRETCGNCGRCILGCPSGAKWDSRDFLRSEERKGPAYGVIILSMLLVFSQFYKATVKRMGEETWS